MRTLDVVLGGVQQRTLMARIIAVAPWALVVGMTAHTLARMSGSTSLMAAMQALTATLCVLLLALAAWRALHPLSTSQAARLIDERLNQHEMFSTALEVEPSSSVVATALHREVAHRAERITASAVVVLRWPVFGSIAILVSAILLVGFPELLGRSWSRQPRDTQEPAVISTTRVGALAEIAESAAETTRNTHMAAVARALDELANEAIERQNEAMSVDTPLGELLQALESLAGLGRNVPSPFREGPTSSDQPGALEDALSRLEERLGRIAGFTGLAEESFVFAEDNWQSLGGLSTNANSGDSPSIDTYPNEARIASQSGSQSVPSLTESDTAGDLSSADLIGAASVSAAGPSSLAGLGTEELFGEGQGDAFDGWLDAVGAAGIETPDGRRVSVELSPELSETSDSVDEFELGAWRSTPLPPATVHGLPFRFRSVAGVFFLPSQETVNRQAATR